MSPDDESPPGNPRSPASPLAAPFSGAAASTSPSDAVNAGVVPGVAMSVTPTAGAIPGAVPLGLPTESHEPFARLEADPPPQVVSIGPFSSQRAANETALVLTSMGVPHHLGLVFGSPTVFVLAEHATRARRVLAQYHRENLGYPPRRIAARPLERGFPWLALGFVALVAFFLQTGPAAQHSRWFGEGTSIASLVLTSEPYRAVTALTLHADASHVIGNALGGAVFGHMLSRRLGSGFAAFTVVGAGILGNLANAGFYAMRDLPHASIGASTAVMAAIGALASSQIVLGTPDPAHRPSIWRYLAPLGAALALLGLLGGNAASDLGAHAFGFGAGVGLGVAVAWVKRVASRRPRIDAVLSFASGLGAVAMLGGAWVLALR